jgi:hypothetical protein
MYVIIICWILAAICNAIMDTLAFKYKRSIFKNLNSQYWNPAKSWRNKYKNKMIFNGPAFIGSTTVLSFLTDAWHLFQFLSNSFLALSVVIIYHETINQNLWYSLGLFIILKVIWGTVFEFLYSTVFRIK